MAGIYLHVPFCIKKCNYCDFYSITDKSKISTFVNSIIREISISMEPPFDTLRYNSIYFGGGTPSLLESAEIESILSALFDNFKFSTHCEITLESNPYTVKKYDLEEFYKIGINRLSIGCQSFNDDELLLLGRLHTAKQAAYFVKISKSIFKNLSIDLIFGLPGQTIKSWQYTLNTAINLKPNHISAYVLSWSKNTLMGRLINSGKLKKPDSEIISDMYLLTSNLLKSAGYNHYEISNFALSGKKSIHNSGYWTGEPYLGLGPSAHSFTGTQRMWNVSNVDKYIQSISSGNRTIQNFEKLNTNDLLLEKIALGLRTSEGIPLDLIGRDKTFIEDIIKKKIAKKEKNHLILLPKGMLLADEIAARFAAKIS